MNIRVLWWQAYEAELILIIKRETLLVTLSIIDSYTIELFGQVRIFFVERKKYGSWGKLVWVQWKNGRFMGSFCGLTSVIKRKKKMVTRHVNFTSTADSSVAGVYFILLDMHKRWLKRYLLLNIKSIDDIYTNCESLEERGKESKSTKLEGHF